MYMKIKDQIKWPIMFENKIKNKHKWIKMKK